MMATPSPVFLITTVVDMLRAWEMGVSKGFLG